MAPLSPRQPTAKERLTGLSLIVIVAVIWIAASFVVQELQMHPFLLTYICNILFVIYIPIAALQDKKRCSSPSFGCCLVLWGWCLAYCRELLGPCLRSESRAPAVWPCPQQTPELAHQNYKLHFKIITAA